MIRHRLAPQILLAALFAASPAGAQEQPINVYFTPPQGEDTATLYKAIQTALSQPPMQLVTKPFAGVLVITVIGKIDVAHKQVSGTYYDFAVSFSRDGNSLGQSQQACNASNLTTITSDPAAEAANIK